MSEKIKSFREMIKAQGVTGVTGVNEDKMDDYENDDTPWTKADLIEMIQEQDLDADDIAEITELVMEIVEYGDFDGEDFDHDNFDWDAYDWDEDDDAIGERMTAKAKKEAKKKRRKPAFKRAMKKKMKCQKKHADRIKQSKNSGVSMVCNVKGKLVKGMGRAEKRKLAKTRKRNKNKIIK